MSRVQLICPSLNTGGIEKSMIRLCKQFCDDESAVDFLVCLPVKQAFYQPDQRANFQRPRWKRRSGWLNTIVYYAQLMIWIRSIARKNQPDLTIVYGDYFGPLVIVALAFLGIPVFVSDRMSPDRRFPWLVRCAKRISYPKAAGFIAQTKRAADTARMRYGDALPICVIPSPVEPAPQGSERRQPTILCVGRLHYEKGMDIAIQAFFEAGLSDWQLKIVGEGPERARLEGLIEELRLNDRVFLLGERRDTAKLMEECAVFLLPSRSEGFPNALCEAMSAGMACVSFNDLNDESIISSHEIDGFLVREKSIASLADGIRKIAENRDLRLKLQSNAAAINQRLDPDYLFQRLARFIKDPRNTASSHVN